MKWDREKTAGTLYAMGNFVVRIAGSLIFLFLVRYAFRYTQYMLPSGLEIPVDILDSRSRNLLWLAGALAVMGMLMFLERRAGRRLQYILCQCTLLAAMAWIALAGIWWLKSSAHVPLGDQAFIYGSASYFIEGDYKHLNQTSYYGMYPFQLGLTALCELLFRVVGAYNYRACQAVNLFLAMGSVYLGHRILSEMTRSTAATVCYDILISGCLPLIFYMPWVYGEIPGIFFALLAEWTLLRYQAEQEKRYLVIMAIALMFAMLVRKNSMILLVAIGLTSLLYAFLHKDRKIVTAFVLAVVLSWGSYQAVYKMYEIRSGHEHSRGFPLVTWMVMGMTEEDGLYGWYNNYPKEVFYGEAEGSLDVLERIAKQDLEERLQFFAGNPDYSFAFFKGKALSQWNQPLYQSLYFNSESPDMQGGPAPDSLAARLYDEDYLKALSVCDRWQFIVYAGMLCYFMFSVKRDSSVLQHTLAVAVIGGFFFSILHEAKARYIFPYYVMMFPFASYGYYTAIGQAMAFLGKHIKNRKVIGIEEGRKAA